LLLNSFFLINVFKGWNNGSSFINSLCKTIDHEYKEELVNEEKDKDKIEEKKKNILKKTLGKRDLTQLFTTFVTPVVGNDATFWQTPEFRSSLSKTIRFRRIQDPVEIIPVYDGETKQPFQHARAYHNSLGWKERKRISDSDYNALFRTIYGETIMKKIQNERVQKAIAWVILNRFNENRDYWGENPSLEKVCDEFKYVNVGSNTGILHSG